MVSSTRPVAAFDFDETLTTRDSVMPFMRTVAGTSGLVQAASRHVVDLALIAVKRGDRDRTKAAMAREIFSGREAATVAAVGATFAEHKVPAILRPDMIGRLRWHQREGHLTVLVSASFGEYLHPFAASHGFDHVLCTELEQDGDGRLTGALVEGNCRGPEKVRRLTRLFQQLDLELPKERWAYGDSAGDNEMLAWATHATRVGSRRVAGPGGHS